MDVKELKKEKVVVQNYLDGIVRDALMKFHAKTGVQIKGVSINIDRGYVLSSKEIEYLFDSVYCELDL